MEAPERRRAAPLLETALLISFVLHVVAMLAMALLLLPGMPGGGSDAAARMAYVAAHPWRWRLGWLPWQLTALSDLAIALALLRNRWLPRLPAVLALLVTLAAILPDQRGQVLWITRGIALAQAGAPGAYAAFEAQVYPWIAGWGTLGYTLTAALWSWCLGGGGIRSRGLTRYASALWSLFALLGAGPLLPPALRLPAGLVAAGNALAFVGLLLWLALVTEQLLRRARPVAAHGRQAPWRQPSPGLWGRCAGLLASSQFLRALCERLPVLAMYSDIRDVIYVNYVVPAQRVEHLVPPGLELQRIGPGGQYAFFTFLTFRHGHFGPRALGPLRRLLPSPVQTNWRIHVRDPRTGQMGVYFLTNAIDSTVHALGARLLSENMPMHVLRSAAVEPWVDGSFALHLDPGTGSGPDAAARFRPAPAIPAEGPWRAAFATYAEMLAYCVPQDRALSTQPWHQRTTRQEIRLDIPLADCQPLVGEVDSRAARAIVGDAPAFAFRVPAVSFRFTRETYDRW